MDQGQAAQVEQFQGPRPRRQVAEQEMEGRQGQAAGRPHQVHAARFSLSTRIAVAFLDIFFNKKGVLEGYDYEAVWIRGLKYSFLLMNIFFCNSICW